MDRGSNRGSVRKRKESGRWQARYRTPTGEKFSATFDTRTDAQQWLRDRLNEVHNGEHDRQRRAEQMTFGEWYADWTAMLSPEDVRDSTRQIYESLARRFLLSEFGDMRLTEINSLHVQRWWAKPMKKSNGDSYAPSYRAKTYRLLKLIFGQAVEHGLLRENPCKVKKVRDTWDERRPPTEHEVDLLVDAAPDRFRALVLIAAYCGLRWGEVAGLRRRDVDVKARTITVAGQALELPNGEVHYRPPKTDASERTVTMPKFVAEEVSPHLARFTVAGDDAPVFTFAHGTGLMRRSNFRPRVWLPTLKAAGLTDIRFHDLRHTAGTLATQEGATLREVMKRLGHATPRAALIYQHASEERDAKIADALDERWAAHRRERASLRAV